MEQARRMRNHNGWSPEETGFLFEEAKLAEASGVPVKSVFDRVALKTGRKPNRIRNYYYLKLKEEGGSPRAAFTPFSDDEVRELMIKMLSEQAKGRSVRGVAFEMGGGDKKLMLRYQNKYRSVLRSDPEYVREIIEELSQNGVEICDPYLIRRKASDSDLSDTVCRFIDAVSSTDADVEMLFGGLLSLALAAKNGNEHYDLKRENAELKRKLSNISMLTSDFSMKGGMEKITSIADFIISLEEQTR